jgi:recombination protein RecR
MFSPSVENLVAQLTRLPGIGQRTAQRLAFHILQRPPEEALALAASPRSRSACASAVSAAT